MFAFQIPPSIYYVPNFITELEESSIISRVNSVPRPKWTQLMNRRLQNWGGIPHPKGMIAEEIPPWLQNYLNRIKNLQLMNGKVPNHVLVNEYCPGQGIMPHVDGDLFYPTITTITCGSHTVLNFRENVATDDIDEMKVPSTFSLLVERKSLLVVQKDMYENFLHSIDDIRTDSISNDIANLSFCSRVYSPGDIIERQTRISLTIRHVPKTSKIKIKI